MELDRSTYDKAEDKAKSMGLNKLGSRFKEHGRERGENQDRENITIVDDGGKNEQTVRMRLAKQDYLRHDEHLLQIDAGHMKFGLRVKEYNDFLEFYDNGTEVYPKTRKDAKKIVNFLEKELLNFDGRKMDLKRMTYDDM
jgi:hypothetical protein